MDCNKDKGCHDKKKQRVYVNNIYVDGDCCDELCEQVEVNTADIAGLKERVTVNEQNIVDSAKDIQKNSMDIANLEPRVSKNEDDIEELQNRADVAEQKLSLSENRITLNEGNITNLVNKTIDMGGSITDLTARVENNEVGIGFLQDGLEETNSNIVELGHKVSDNKGSIDVLNARVGTAEGEIAERYTKAEVNAFLDNKVNVITGKGLSSNDYTSDEKTKLAGIATGANKTMVENILSSTSIVNALSAAQGKVLNDAKINLSDLVFLKNATNGYHKFPNGFTIQWGRLTFLVSSGSLRLTFPLAFTNFYAVTFGADNWTAGTSIPKVFGSNNAYLDIGVTVLDFGAEYHPYWIAIGYIIP